MYYFSGVHGFHNPRLRISCSSLTSTPSSFPLTSLPASFLSCSPSLTLPSLSISCLPSTSLCSSSPCTALSQVSGSAPNIALLLQICSACVRCKSCGATPGKNWDVEWSGDYSLCPRCTQLYEKGGDLAGVLGPGSWGSTGEWARLLQRQLEQMLLSSCFPPSFRHGLFPSVQDTLQ